MAKITATFLKNTLYDSINDLLKTKESYLSKPDTAFSRTQKISFRDTLLFPMIAAGESTPVEMLDFFPASKLPTAAAMNYRREQVNVSAFRDLMVNFTSKLPNHKTFKQLRVIAVDGTRLNTPFNPNDSGSFANFIPGRRGFNQYHLNTCMDILNDQFIDAVIQGCSSMDEKHAFCEMMDRYCSDKPSVFVADRGYSSYNVIAHAIKNNHFFVIRLTSNIAQNIFDRSKELDDSCEYDTEDVINIGRTKANTAKNLPNYHYIRASKKYDYIQPGSSEIDSFNVRMVKFVLPSGCEEYLLTNLDKDTFSTADIKEIYRLRWGIETSYRYLKYVSGLVHIHSLKPKFIFQEIYAKLTCYNFCAAIMGKTKVDKSSKKKHEYKADKTYLFKSCIRFLKGQLKSISKVTQNKKVPVRAGRTFERNMRRQHADTLQYR